MWEFTFAKHGEWCNARTYPTQCRYCGAEVFYFECDHGSRVFFDELGPPWPKHRCFEFLVAEYGKDFIAVAMAVQMMLPGGQPVGQEPRKSVSAARRPGRRSTVSIVCCLPMEGQDSVEDEGIVREVIYVKDILHHLHVSEQSLAAQILGQMRLVTDGFQVTVHAPRGDERTATTWLSYTFLIPRD